MIFAAVLRAVNVGGTGKLAMSELRALCEELGYADVKTYIQSGNVVFSTKDAAKKVQAALESALHAKLGKPCRVHLRTLGQLRAVVERNPFPEGAPSQVAVVFLDSAPTAADVRALKIPGREQIEASGSEAWVHYPDGMGRSKLQLPFAKQGTARNLNTVRKLLELAESLQ